MNRVLFCVCLMLALLVAPAFATQGAVNGVLVEERVVTLPQDQDQWYISVVGEAGEARYQKVLGWFDTNADLKHLKGQVHFCPVRSNSAIYKERYAPNVKGLPTVRVQDSKGVVIYEAAGDAIPMTAEGLFGAIADDAQKAQGCILRPWRKICPGPGPCPTPTPDPEPQPLDPEPQPLDPAPGPPDIVRPTQSALPPWWAMLLALAAGNVVGVAQKWGETHKKK